MSTAVEGRSVRALERGLDILQLLNQHNGLTVTEVGQRTDLPRPSAFRLLRTLERKGFVFRDTGDKKYRLTVKVRQLAGGFDGEEWVDRIARPEMLALGTRVIWPIVLSTNDGPQMLVRANTDFESPLALVRNRGGIPISLINSSTGLAWLAFAPATVRDTLIDLVFRESPEDAGPWLKDRDGLLAMLEKVRADGYAIFQIPERRHGGLAVPVFSEGDLIGGLAMRFIPSALTPEEVVQRYFADVRDTAAQIGRKVAEWRRENA